MKIKVAVLACALALVATPVSVRLQAAAPKVPAQIEALAKSLKPQHGKIAIPAAKATLNLGAAYDFYGPGDARAILVDLWGNPPDAAADVLGLVLLAGKSPLTDTWGAVVTFEDTGHVSDEDAAEVDYADLMSQMQDGQGAENEERKSAGYPEIQLVGWAQQPVYDQASHSVVWARNLKFSDSPANTLNYDIRTLGRSGVLSLNLISSMPQIGTVRTAANDFSKLASFDPGARYADFNSSTDRAAEYGIGGLIAAGAGVAVAKKLGIFALLIKFAKPLLIGLFALFAVFRNKVMGLFSRKSDPLEGE